VSGFPFHFHSEFSFLSQCKSVLRALAGAWPKPRAEPRFSGFIEKSLKILDVISLCDIMVAFFLIFDIVEGMKMEAGRARAWAEPRLGDRTSWVARATCPSRWATGPTEWVDALTFLRLPYLSGVLAHSARGGQDARPPSPGSQPNSGCQGARNSRLFKAVQGRKTKSCDETDLGSGTRMDDRTRISGFLRISRIRISDLEPVYPAKSGYRKLKMNNP
jgi:hypothetical protein